MKKLSISFALLILFILVSVPIKGQCDLKDMKIKVLGRIKEDLANQDTSFFLFDLYSGVDEKKWKGDRYNDTISFSFQDGCYLRFYLLTDNVSKDMARLSLIKNTGDLKKLPIVILKEIKSTGISGKIISFDYYTKEVEQFYLVLNQNNNSSGCSFAAATQYKLKK
jgi:hypothetical protein